MPTLQEQILDKVNSIIQKIDSLPELAQIAGNQVKIVQLSDVAKSLGLIQAGEFRAGNSIVPGFGFSGVRIGYPPFTYNSSLWHIAGVSNDVLQFGLNATDGKAYAGGGTVVMQNNGIQVEVVTNTADDRSYKFVNTSGDVVGGTYAYYQTSGGEVNAVVLSTAAADALTSMAVIANRASFQMLDYESIQSYVVINAASNDVDTYIKGDNDANLVFVNAGADLVAFGGDTETGYKVKVNGKFKVTGDISLGGGADSDITSDELETLTDGSNADSLHTHAVGTQDVYTPTLTGVANVDATTNYQCHYTRVGDMVTVFGTMQVDPTAATTLTKVGISLPIASTFSNTYECSGVMSSADNNGFITADTSNNRAEVWYTSVGTANREFKFTFAYLVI